MAKRKTPIGNDEKIKSFIDMIAPSIIKFNTDHFICGNTYRCVWALREYPTSTNEQAILRHLEKRMGLPLGFIPGRLPQMKRRKSFIMQPIRIG